MPMWWKFWNRRARPVDLMFRWRRPRAISFRLGFFLLISVTVHFAAFYVFEVVYPPNKKILPRDGAVWMLPDNNPQVQALLARHAGALGAFRAVGVAVDGDRAGAAALVPFRLSFDSYQPRFEPLPPRSLGKPLEYPDAVPVVLPPVEEPGGDAAQAVARATGPVAIWMSADGKDAVAPWTGPLPTWPGQRHTGASWEFQIACDRHGRVVEAVMAKGTGTGADALVRRQLLGLQVPDAMPRPNGPVPVWLTVNLDFPVAADD